MPLWLVAAINLTAKVLASIARSAMGLLAAFELGRKSSENDRLVEEQEQVKQANEIYESDPDEYPDRYTRD